MFRDGADRMDGSETVSKPEKLANIVKLVLKAGDRMDGSATAGKPSKASKSSKASEAMVPKAGDRMERSARRGSA